MFYEAPGRPRARTARRVAITGIGCITPIGAGAEGLWQGLQRGRSAVRRIERFDPSPFRSHIAAQVDDFEPTDYIDRNRVKRLDRYGQFAIAATRLALDDAALGGGFVDPDRVAVQMGSALGGVGHGEQQLNSFLKGGVRAVDPTLALTVFDGAAT